MEETPREKLNNMCLLVYICSLVVYVVILTFVFGLLDIVFEEQSLKNEILYVINAIFINSSIYYWIYIVRNNLINFLKE